MSTCPMCQAEFEQSGRGRPATYCSPACRTDAWRQRAGAIVEPDAEPGANLRALDETVADLHPEVVNPALVQAARTLAEQVDRAPDSSPLWARYLQVLESLRTATVTAEDKQLSDALAQISAAGPSMCECGRYHDPAALCPRYET